MYNSIDNSKYKVEPVTYENFSKEFNKWHSTHIMPDKEYMNLPLRLDYIQYLLFIHNFKKYKMNIINQIQYLITPSIEVLTDQIKGDILNEPFYYPLNIEDLNLTQQITKSNEKNIEIIEKIIEKSCVILNLDFNSEKQKYHIIWTELYSSNKKVIIETMLNLVTQQIMKCFIEEIANYLGENDETDLNENVLKIILSQSKYNFCESPSQEYEKLKNTKTIQINEERVVSINEKILSLIMEDDNPVLYDEVCKLLIKYYKN